MLESIDLKKRLKKEDYEREKKRLADELMCLQQQCVSEKLPVVICVDGWGASGKGTTISKLVKDLDPRSFRVYPMAAPTQQERRYPFMTRYWERVGQHGTITIFDRSWYGEAMKILMHDYPFPNKGKKGKAPHPLLRDTGDFAVTGTGGTIGLYAESAHLFERQLINDGYLIIKCFFHVSKQAQKERIDKLCEDESTSWRVTDSDIRQNRHYDEYYPIIDTLLERTNAADSMWHLIPADNQRVRRIAFMQAIADEMREALERKRLRDENPVKIPENFPLPHSRYTLLEAPDVEELSHSLALDEQTYVEELKQEQDKLSALQMKLYHRGIPMMIVFEGWDAAGKGGAIKRVASALDARDYRVVPSAAPTREEKEHPFLWRYWKNLPKSGHVCIYDRSWYGRVMVERIEGFCTDEDWRRAFEEINDFEWEMYRSGTLVVKFWINVSQDEQLARFNERKNNPEKAWKLTDEDWRNREKYPQYRQAINDMFRLTSTNFAPWHYVESDDKKYARIKVLKTINAAIEKRLKEK